MAESLTIPDKQGKVKNSNPLPVQIVEGEDIVDVEELAGKGALTTYDIAKLVPKAFDYFTATYVAAGNGAGKIETVIYKTGGASGTTVATVTITYNANDRISTVIRT